MPRAELSELLSKVPVFAGLSREELSELAALAHTKRVPAKRNLFHKGDAGSTLYVIVSGRLRVTTHSAQGRDVLLGIMGPGEVFGELALLAEGSRSATVTALDDCELLTLDRRDFLPRLRRHPELSIRLLEVLAVRLLRISEFVEDTLFLNLPARLAKKLLHLAADYGQPVDGGIRIDLKLSQQELGAMVGTSRESINKQLRSWEEAGLVRMEQGYVTLRSREALEDLAGLVSG